MKTSASGLALIRHFEGCKLKAYHCPANILTIGYGHTGSDVKEGMIITQDKADELLFNDVCKFEIGLSNIVSGNIKQCQFDAFISFVYNLGLNSLKNSTLLKLMVAGKPFNDVAEQFLRWNKAGGKELAGLTKRRIAEKRLFLGENIEDILK